MFDIPPMAPPPGAAPQPNGWDGSGNAFKRVLEEVRLFEYAAQQAPTNVWKYYSKLPNGDSRKVRGDGVGRAVTALVEDPRYT
eukprot:gene28265-8429_t